MATALQDGTEAGIGGVPVTLTGTTGDGQAVTLTTTTAPDGSYEFTGLEPGTYKVTFGTPAGYTPVAPDQGGDDTLDSDAGVGGMTPNEVLTSGENNTTYDAGFYQLGSIGDYVWEDTDGDGVQDGTEAGIGGVPVTLTGTTGDGQPVTLNTTTAPDGSYLFDNLEPGTYKVTFGTPAGYTPVAPDQGGNDALDSDAGVGGMTPNEVLESGENNTTYDAGFYQQGSIGDYVWEDTDGDGLQDGTEAGIGGVPVTLTGTTGDGQSVTLTTTTAPDGSYLFDNLEPGTYKVMRSAHLRVTRPWLPTRVATTHWIAMPE
ncbi:MAG: carboxypeptidase regulatory-like domain-containing protein [Saprospiraceae bacterium]|nr:carboxypeptidase regulatory-like domain-containing protein [Saprospiraceae bacterium]